LIENPQKNLPSPYPGEIFYRAGGFLFAGSNASPSNRRRRKENPNNTKRENPPSAKNHPVKPTTLTQ
jgi:hypothetical protein